MSAEASLLPARLNLSVARRCFVSCPGCYSLFGAEELDVDALLASVAVFVGFGVDSVTISGGDPLTIRDLDRLLDGLRERGIRTIKLDTVGTSLLGPAQTLSREGDTMSGRDVRALLAKIDQIAIPLDGASNESAARFRKGRAKLFDEALAILEAIEAARGAEVMINTVAHAHNLDEFDTLADVLVRFRRIVLWNVFQYTPTDQARPKANAHFEVSDEAFARLEARTKAKVAGTGLNAEFWSVKGRLGAYLLINSDGDVWMPDTGGGTVRLGKLYGREAEMLAAWRTAAAVLQPEGAAA